MIPFVPQHADATSVGKYFDNVVFIALENQRYGTIFGTGSGNSTNALFISSLLSKSSAAPNYRGYGAGGRCIGGCSPSGFNATARCSAACYASLISGAVCFNGYSYNGGCVSDGYSCCIDAPTLMDRLSNAGLSWAAYCEDGNATPICRNQRGNDHFPFTAFQSTYNSPNIHASTGPLDPEFAGVMNANPPNVLWLTPTDCNNMHGANGCTNGCNDGGGLNCVGAGDTYIKNLLVGSTGSIALPASGSLFATNLFRQLSSRVLLILWWDEPGNTGNGSYVANLFYGPVVKQGFVSSTTHFDHYSVLRLVEDNWNLPTLVSANDGTATGLANEIIDVKGDFKLVYLGALVAAFIVIVGVPLVIWRRRGPARITA